MEIVVDNLTSHMLSMKGMRQCLANQIMHMDGSEARLAQRLSLHLTNAYFSISSPFNVNYYKA